MLIIDNQNHTDPAINLALEEHCYRNLNARHDYLLLYINRPSIIIGNHQSPFQEINMALAARQQIRTIRRISGGGAVYHDNGNLNFSFITEFGPEKLDYFKRLLQPILDTLNRLGVPAQLSGKNNLVVDNKKISGNSQHANMRRMLSHGTLLFDADLETLRQVLRSNLDIVRSRAIASIPARVTNIADHLPRPLEMKAFIAELMAGLSERFGSIDIYQLAENQWNAVYRLADVKYRSWEWNIGRTPEFTVTHRVKIDTAAVAVNLRIKNAVIEALEFAEPQPLPEMMVPIRANLMGQPYDPCHPDLR